MINCPQCNEENPPKFRLCGYCGAPLAAAVAAALPAHEVRKTVTVVFPINSATLGPKAKATIDEAAAWVKTQNTKGWVMAVIGYADSTGNSQRNIDLSERRANAVIYYIVSKHKMPLNRLVQPFGYGQLEPVAENKTKAGRAKNRRVEIRLMVNKGIAGTVGNGQN